MPAPLQARRYRCVVLTTLGWVLTLCLAGPVACAPARSGGSSSASAAAAEPRRSVKVTASPSTRQASVADDLTALQGTWERTQVVPAQTGPRSGRVVKVVEGNRETVTTYDAAGNATYAHAVEFRLERQGNVRVFTFFNREVTAGPTRGQKVPEPSSYIYRLGGEGFEEVWGFLPGQEQRDLLAAKWKRVRGS